jgi:hypothetical protein
MTGSGRTVAGFAMSYSWHSVHAGVSWQWGHQTVDPAQARLVSSRE